MIATITKKQVSGKSMKNDKPFYWEALLEMGDEAILTTDLEFVIKTRKGLIKSWMEKPCQITPEVDFMETDFGPVIGLDIVIKQQWKTYTGVFLDIASNVGKTIIDNILKDGSKLTLVFYDQSMGFHGKRPYEITQEFRDKLYAVSSEAGSVNPDELDWKKAVEAYEKAQRTSQGRVINYA